VDGGDGGKTLNNFSAGDVAGVSRLFEWHTHRPAILGAIRKLIARI
jgi:hypothetical protein